MNSSEASPGENSVKPGYDYAYAWRNGPRWAWSSLMQGRVLVFLRTLWITLALGYIGEGCQECGRPYFMWHADEALYAEVTDYNGPMNEEGRFYPAAPGLYCPACFDRKADSKGILLQWKPEIVRRRV